MATTQPIVDVAELGGKTKDQLLDVAESVGLGESSGLTNLRREDLLSRILQTASSHQALTASGILEIMDEGYGFLRQVAYSHTTGDVYISQSQIRRFGLKTGDTVTGQVRPPKEGERYFGLVRVEKVNGFDPEQTPSRSRPQFEYLTPIFPDQQIILETDSSNLSRIRYTVVLFIFLLNFDTNSTTDIASLVCLNVCSNNLTVFVFLTILI